MIRFSPLPSNIEELLPKGIESLRADPDVVFAYLFGGLTRGKPLPLSDVDIAVYFREGLHLPEKKVELLIRLTDVLETDEIDLVVLNSAPLTLRMKILENKKVVVDKAPFVRHRFESLTMREYFDFSIKERVILNRRFFGGR